MLGIASGARVAERRPSPYLRAEREELPMQSENKLFDDFVKMVNGMAGTFAGMGREAEASAREKMREWMAGSDFVGRDEFEAVKAMAAAARDENEVPKLAGPVGGAAKRTPKAKPGA